MASKYFPGWVSETMGGVGLQPLLERSGGHIIFCTWRGGKGLSVTSLR